MVGAPAQSHGTYLEQHYLEDVAQAPSSLQFEGAVFVEALSDDPTKVRGGEDAALPISG